MLKSKIESGFSLVELMIAMVIGSLLILLISDSYIKSTVSISKLNDIKALESQLNDVSSFIVKEIKRSGFVNYSVEAQERNLSTYRRPLTVNGVNYKSPFTLDAKGRCVIFFYDTNKNGCVGDINSANQCNSGLTGNVDFVGFKLDGDEIKYSPSKTDDCNTGGWESITDEKKIKIETLTISIVSVNSVLSVDDITKLNFPVISLFIKASSVKDASIKRDITRVITLESPML